MSAKSPSSLVSPPGRKYFFERWAQFGNISSSTTLFTNYAFAFRLNDLPQYAEFTNLFDQYRIKRVTLHLVPQATESIPSAAMNGVMFIVRDYDDANTLSTNLDYMQYQNLEISNLVFNGVKQISLVPRIAVATYGSAFTSYGNTEMWLDVASPAVEHYAIKIGMSTSTAVMTYQVLVKYELEFANPR